ncbi:hypothetical protein N7510_010772 [Penicillium lagena]|uniref:uncharacterized protein n=1 Tax=Penicillium lagena TaxID=94218 RepID=UPI002540655E|nr:uncharacterized protein N7510_010772 [Penicillium lagena]KAJ5601238.1 hypothetical protein N7510_010772 [Penicillium lagena]
MELRSVTGAKQSKRYQVAERPVGDDESDSQEGNPLTGNSLSKHKPSIPRWRLTIFGAVALGVVVLAFNLGFTLWAVGHRNLESGVGTLNDGKCDQVRDQSIALHLIINILSTILLGASNYCMVSGILCIRSKEAWTDTTDLQQRLSSPTRKDLNEAHRKHRWLDIGVPTRLTLKSYNSTIFSTTSANDYDVFLVGREDFVYKSNSPYNDPLSRLHKMAGNGELAHLDNKACINSYAVTYLSAYGSLLLVTSNMSQSQYAFVAGPKVVNGGGSDTNDPYSWICQDHSREHDCNYYVPTIRDNSAEWKIQGNQVHYCLAETTQERCLLQFSLPLAIIVIAFNSVKVFIMLVVAMRMNSVPLLTTGDAIASYLKEPDPTTRYQCLLAKDQRAGKGYAHFIYSTKVRRWGSAASNRRWVFTLGCCALALFICMLLLGYGLHVTSDDTGAWMLGLGATSSQTLIHGVWPTSTIANTLIANCPQLIFSMLYFAINGLLSAMALAHEWSQYAVQRKGLRVSACPTGSQRTSYFLSLPFRYSLPMTAVSATLHWLISQSLFLVKVFAYNTDGNRDPGQDVVTCAWSPVATLSVIIIGGLCFFVLIGMGVFRKFESGMPVASSCSLAISAACQPVPERIKEIDPISATLPLKWGVMNAGSEREHCGFSSEEVEAPQHGRVYR